MADAKIVLSAVDQTQAAFASMAAGLKGLRTSATNVTGVLGTLGVTAAGLSFAASIKGAIEAADQINKLSQRTGIATEQLSQLQFAAKMSDVGIDALTTGLKKLNVSISEGLGGNDEKLEMFKNLGISLTDASGKAKTADKVMLEMANAFSAAKDGATKTAYAVGLMGKAGDEMIPLLNGGARSITDMMDKANKLGLTISSDFAKKAEQFNDNLTILKSSSDRLVISLGAGLVDSLGAVAQKMADAAEKGGKLKGILEGALELANQLTGVKGADGLFDAKKLADAAAKVIDLEAARVRLTNGMANGFYSPAFKADLDKVNADLAQAKAAFKSLDAAMHPNQNDKPLPTGDFARLDRKPKPADLPPLKGPPKEASDYDALIKRIKERISVSDAELKKGRELTESEKFEAKAIADLAAIRTTLTVAQKKNFDATLAQAKASGSALETRKKVRAGYIAETEADLATQAEIDAATKAAADAYNSTVFSIADQTQALAENNLQLKLEASLLGATDRERQVALGNLKIDLDLKRQEEELNKNLLLNEEQRAHFRQQLSANADTQRAQLAQNAGTEELRRNLETLDGVGHEVFNSLAQGGSDSFKRIGDTLRTAVLDQLYQLTLKKWIVNIGANISESLGGAGGGGGLLGSLFGLKTGGGSAADVSAVESSFDAHHGGGIAGGKPTFRRNVDPSVFVGARKYHTGGLVEGEVPAILKRGEGVFTPEQMKALGGSGGAGRPAVTIVNNNTIGDVASMAQVQEQLRASERRSLAALRRSTAYGGSLV